ERVVEVAAGGLDYANPDMLTEKYRHLGEGHEFDDPREAVEAAIEIARAWRRDAHTRRIGVGVGATGRFTLPFEPGSFAHARAWATEQYERLPKCGRCGGLLGRTKYALPYSDDVFCSEQCAEDEFRESYGDQ